MKRFVAFVGLMLLLVVALAIGSGCGGFVQREKLILDCTPRGCFVETLAPPS